MIPDPPCSTIYELALTARVTWQAHSLSNTDTHGSNHLLGRHQVLADGTTETDACTGNITKHMHAVLTAEYLEALGVSLCPACARRDGRCAGALVDQGDAQPLTVERILQECGLCDAHGFLIPAKHASLDGSSAERLRVSKHTLVDFSFVLALPARHGETIHLLTRSGNSLGEGQMLMKVPARSGVYAWSIRYKAVGVGVDTDRWQVVVPEGGERLKRHQAILSALRDLLLSPEGALTAAQMPHLTGLTGVVVLRQTVGRAQTYSALEDDFVSKLCAMADERTTIYPFAAVDDFYHLMNRLVETTVPALPHQRKRDDNTNAG